MAMAKTLTQIQAQISKLQAQADAIKAKEVAQVVARIQEAIAHYGITTDMLFGPKAVVVKTAARKGTVKTADKGSAKAAAKSAVKKAPAPAKYQDGAGRTWSGHGKRPNWYKDAIASGKTVDDLLIKTAAA